MHFSLYVYHIKLLVVNGINGHFAIFIYYNDAFIDAFIGAFMTS